MDADWDDVPEALGGAASSSLGPRVEQPRRATAKVVKKEAVCKKPANARPKTKPQTKKPAATTESVPIEAIPANLQNVGVRTGGVRVASDCSGWCSELWAFKGMSLAVEEIFCSERDPATARSLKHLWGEDTPHLFKDRTCARVLYRASQPLGHSTSVKKHTSNLGGFTSLPEPAQGMRQVQTGCTP